LHPEKELIFKNEQISNNRAVPPRPHQRSGIWRIQRWRQPKKLASPTRRNLAKIKRPELNLSVFCYTDFQ
jgi:hypothetical protein